MLESDNGKSSKSSHSYYSSNNCQIAKNKDDKEKVNEINMNHNTNSIQMKH